MMSANYYSPNSGAKLEILENGLLFDPYTKECFTIRQIVVQDINNRINKLEKLKLELLETAANNPNYSKDDIDSIMKKYFDEFKHQKFNADMRQFERESRDYKLNSRKLDILDMEVDEIAAAGSSNVSSNDMYDSLNDALQSVGLEKNSKSEYPLDSHELESYMNTATNDLNVRLDAKERIDQNNSEKLKNDIEKIDAMIEYLKQNKEETIKTAKQEFDEYLLAMQNKEEKQRTT